MRRVLTTATKAALSLGYIHGFIILSRDRKLLLSVAFVLALLWACNVRVFAESTRLLHGEVEAFTKRLELIEDAKSSVDLDYYEISADETSGPLLAALLRAVDRSISIRIMAVGHREEVPRVASRQKHLEWNCMPRCEAMEQVKSWLSEVSAAPIAAADLRCGSQGFDTLKWRVATFVSSMIL